MLFVSVIICFLSIESRVLDLANSKETYETLEVFTEVLSHIQNNYVKEVDSQELVYGAIKGMLKELDPHTSFMTEEMYKEMQIDTKGEFGGLGIQIAVKDGILTVIAPIEDTPAYRIGIKAGDQIVMVNEEPTSEMSLMDAVKKMRGLKGTQVTITIMRKGFKDPKDFTITRDIIKTKSVKYEMIEEKIAYIRLTQFQERTSTDLENALKDLNVGEGELDGLILDLRNNPGGLLDQAVGVCNKFLKDGELIVYTEGRKKNQNLRYTAHGRSAVPDFPIIVLINGGSASASEIVAGALQDWGRAVILGTQSFGKGSVQTVVRLNDGSGLRLTTSEYFTPSGRSIQAKGITPDIEVEWEEAVKEDNNSNKSPHFREKDLKHHLESEEEKKERENGIVEEEKENEEEEENEEKEEEKIVKRDNQLQRAVDLIKSWIIFKGSSPFQQEEG